jgi:site-specific DNA recombinase
MRVALYARYSTDQQRAASIDDQLQTCAAFAASRGWNVVHDYSDAGVSGATLMRAGIQSLMRDAAARKFDGVLAEALDRFSRDQEDIAHLAKQLKFAGVKLVTVSEGEITPLHIGLKGTMNALFPEDLADKTRRGLRGRVEAGRSGGGISYGYRVVHVLDGQPRGESEIHPEEAVVVRRIFRDFVAGVSPKAIGKALNAERVSGPRSAVWSPSTIHGHAGRGTGILNNELYIGRRVWNRQRYVKNPDTRKRVARPNPPSEWISRDVPELRIVDDDLWSAVKARQAATRHTVKTGIVRARRPKYLFSGLTKCGACGGGFNLSSHDHLVCFNARVRGICTNLRSIKRQEVEARVLRAIQERLLEAGAFAEFCASFTEELNRLRREHRVKLSAAPREIASIDSRVQQMLNLLVQGFLHEAFKEELRRLEMRKAELTAAIAAAEIDPPMPLLHPKMAEVFREKAATLAAGLEHDDQRDHARAALRNFVEKIVVPSETGLLQVVGNLGAMLEAAAGQKMPGRQAVGYVGCGGGI